MEHYVTAFEEDWVIQYDYRITSRGCAARISGPPEDCYPAEPMEYEIEVVSMGRDVPKPDVSHWADQGRAAAKLAEWEARVACVEIPAWLRETLEDYLMNDDRVYQEISDEEEGYAPRRRRFA